MDSNFQPKLWEYIRARDLLKLVDPTLVPEHLRRNPDKVVALILYDDAGLFGPGNYMDNCPREPAEEEIRRTVCGKRTSISSDLDGPTPNKQSRQLETAVVVDCNSQGCSVQQTVVQISDDTYAKIE
jgi:hypothetical protein